MDRLQPIEGLRAYLSLWVMVAHLLFVGFHPALLNDPPKWLLNVLSLLRDGPYAVHIFMIISGFVIFYLLDKKRENYRQFIYRRFFRLYPLYVLALTAALLLVPLREWVTVAGDRYMDPSGQKFAASLAEPHSDTAANIILHYAMAHGSVPYPWMSRTSSYSFIFSAWSIPIEWHFYLLAPLLYGVCTTRRSAWRLVVPLIFFAILSYLQPRFYFNAFILIYSPYFFLGIISYFLYRKLPTLPPDTVFPASLGLGFVIYYLSFRQGATIPLVIWLGIFGLLCERPDAISSRLLLPLLTNRIILYLGAISYGIYLCHELVITLLQATLLTFRPELTPSAYLTALSISTFGLTIALASWLHYAVELPFMEYARKRVQAWK